MKWTLVMMGAVLATQAGAALADDLTDFDRRRAGTKGHVTAYEADGMTIIDVDACPNGYVKCGDAFRESINNRLCAKHGTGRHPWFYQIGDSKKLSHMTNCKGSASASAGAADPGPSAATPTSSAGAMAGGGDADDYDRRHAGTKGYVSAYEADRMTVIDVDACPNGYVSCGSAFRESIKNRMCRKHGPGRHTWYYQTGDSPTRIANTAICK